MSTIIAENELMKNQKSAEVLPAQADFQAVQTSTGNSIFLAVGDKKELNLIVQTPGNQEGWSAIDISSELSKVNNNKAVTAKNFAVTQLQGAGDITIALTINVDGANEDQLYVLSNLSSDENTNWQTKDGTRDWVTRPYDDTQHPVTDLNIQQLYLTPQSNAKQDTHLVCEVKQGDYLQNYTVALSGSNAWAELQTSENFNQVLSQTVGKAKVASFSGLYQLTELNGETAITFVPLQSFFGPPTVIKLNAPAGATKLATLSVDDQNNTNLFVAANGGIYLFTPEAQDNFASGTLIIDNSLIAGIQNFYAVQSSTETILWGLNQQGQVFSSRCPIGSESNKEVWSAPIPILSHAEQISTYVNHQTGTSVLFAHTTGQNLVRLSRDAQTTIWNQSNILLPAPDVNTVLEYTTYTSHVQLTDSDNIPYTATKVEIKATSQCNVFINNVYYILSATVPVTVETDNAGQLSIVQETQSLGAICYDLKIVKDGTSLTVNPMTKITNKIDAIKNGDDLGNVQITNADGTKQSLLKSSITKTQKDNTAAALQNFASISKKLPQNGTVQSSKKTTKLASAPNTASFIATSDTIWGMSFENGSHEFHHGEAALQRFGLQHNPTTQTFALQSKSVTLNSIWDAIEAAAGDIWNWLKSAYNDVKNFFVKVVDDVYHFFIEIAGKMYRFVLDCVNDVIHAVEFVLNKIEVFIEDLIKWLGFLFQWKDILRTHDVLKNVIKQYVSHSITEGENLKTQINHVFKNIETCLNDWAGIQLPDGTLAQKSSSTQPVAGQHSPQANYGSTHLKNGINEASTNVNAPTIGSSLEQLLKTLENSIETEKDIFENAYNTIKNDIVGQIQNLSLGDIIKKLLAVLGDVLIESVESIIDTTIDVLLELVNGLFAALDAKLEIPVLSWLYKLITGNDLSILDVVCLAMAIPTTITYKLALNKTPFPDNSTTSAIISASNWQGIANALGGTSNTLRSSAGVSFLATSATTENDDLKQGFIIFLRLVAAFSTPVFMVFSTAKAALAVIDQHLNPLNIVHAISFYCTTAPNFASGLIANSEQTWYQIVNESAYGVTVLQKFADAFTANAAVRAAWGQPSRVIDCILGVIGLVPSFAAPISNPTVKSITGGVANTSWNSNRILTPFASLKNEAEAKVFAGKMILVGIYGIGQFVLFVEECAIGEPKSLDMI